MSNKAYAGICTGLTQKGQKEANKAYANKAYALNKYKRAYALLYSYTRMLYVCFMYAYAFPPLRELERLGHEGGGLEWQKYGKGEAAKRANCLQL